MSWSASLSAGRVTWDVIPLRGYHRTRDGHDVLHGGAIELFELLTELTVREESLSESVGSDLLVVKWNGDFFSQLKRPT